MIKTINICHEFHVCNIYKLVVNMFFKHYSYFFQTVQSTAPYVGMKLSVMSVHMDIFLPVKESAKVNSVTKIYYIISHFPYSNYCLNIWLTIGLLQGVLITVH